MTEETKLNCSVNHNYREGYQQGRADALAGVFSKMEQPDRCVFNSKNNCCYPISSCWECPISEVKEQKNE